MLEDLLTSAKQTLLDRLASPLIGSFVLAWPLWNWKFIVILMSSNTVSMTFALIEKWCFPTSQDVMLRGFLWPLASALVYVFVYPYPARYIYGVVRRHQAELNRRKQQIEGEELLTREQSRELRAAIRKQAAGQQLIIDQLMAEVEDLKRKRLSEEVTPLVADVPQRPTVYQGGKTKRVELVPTDVIPEDQLKALKVFGESGARVGRRTGVNAEDISQGMGVPLLKAQYLIDRLTELSLIEFVGSGGYALTAKGRRVLVESGGG